MVHEKIIIREFNKRPIPDLAHRANLAYDLRDGLLAVSGAEVPRAGAELAVVRAAARGLDRNTVVVLGVQQVESRHGRLRKVVKLRTGRAVDSLEAAFLQVGRNRRPERFGLAQHDGIGVLEGLLAHGRHVRAAHDDLGAAPAEQVGHRVRLADLRRVGGNGDRVIVPQPPHGEVLNVRDFDVLDFHLRRRQGGQGQQREARQGGNDVAAGDELGQRDAQPRQLRVDDAHTTHGQQAQLHLAAPNEGKSPLITLIALI